MIFDVFVSKGWNISSVIFEVLIKGDAFVFLRLVGKIVCVLLKWNLPTKNCTKFENDIDDYKGDIMATQTWDEEDMNVSVLNS